MVVNAFGLNQEIRNRSPAIDKSLNELFHSLLLLRGALGELDAQSYFRMHHSNLTLHVEFDVCDAHGEHEPGANGERRSRLQIAPAQAEIAKFTSYRGI